MLVRRLANQVLDLLFPPRCVQCGRLDYLVCPPCLALIEWVKPPYCLRCGRALSGPARNVERCETCATRPMHLDAVRAAMEFSGVVRQAVHAFKYEGQRQLAGVLGEWMAQAWPGTGLAADYIVPVPLHPRRLRERGYNQATLLADELSEKVNLPVFPEILMRSRMTKTQIELSAPEREKNVAGAFAFVGPDSAVAGRTVLLVDDVRTTGATLNACAGALKQAGAARVLAFTLSRAPWNPTTGVLGNTGF